MRAAKSCELRNRDTSLPALIPHINRAEPGKGPDEEPNSTREFMGALANQSFVKMNGIGNEIVVVDLRAHVAKIEPDEARAAAPPQGAPYDQLLALYAPRTPGPDAFVRIYNNDGSEAGACGPGMGG